MVIIFNLWAIPAIVIIYLIVLGLAHFWPGVMTDTLTGWTTGIVSTIVGAICEVVGIKARVFLLPIWMIGLGIICFNLGWPGACSWANDTQGELRDRVWVGDAIELFREGVYLPVLAG